MNTHTDPNKQTIDYKKTDVGGGDGMNLTV